MNLFTDFLIQVLSGIVVGLVLMYISRRNKK